MNYKRYSVLLLTGVIGIFLAAAVFVGAFLGHITEKMDKSANETLLNATRVIQSSLNNELQLDEQLLETFSSLFSENNRFQDPVKALSSYAGATEFYRYSYVDLTGKGVDSAGNPVDAGKFSFEESALSRGELSYTDAYEGDSGRLQITFQAPVFLDGVQVGALYADKTLNRYNDPALFTFSGGEGHAYVVREDGSWIMESTGTDSDSLYAFLEENGNGRQAQEALQKLLREHKAGTIQIGAEGENSLLCFLPLENGRGWYLVSILPRRILQQESADLMRLITGTLLVLLAALLLVAVLLLSRQAMKAREKGRAYREQLFQNISSNVDFAFLLYSPGKRRMEMVSDNVEHLFRITPEQVLQQPALIFEQCGIPGEDPDRQAFFNGGLRGRIRKEYSTGAENGLQRWTEVHLLPADNGQYLAVLHDTTQEHHMREDLADALRQSQESNRARTAFFSSMSHDIRTPMNGIVGMTAIAMSNLNRPEKVKDCLEKITVASDHLLSLINEVLDMSRIESGKLSLKEEAVDLPALVSSVLLFIRPELNKKRQTLHVKSAVLGYDTVIGDTLHLQKILLNLLSNAVKYTPEGGQIFLRLQERTRGDGRLDVVFQVEDNGVGMKADFLERIFQPFSRAEDTRVSRVNGTGLGMAITKSIVDRMGGVIEVESEYGKGSKFTVSIPLPLQETQALRETELCGCSVLIVDDDRDACEGMQSMLEEAGIQADWVLSGREAVDAAGRAHRAGEDYFAVIMDWRMPEMDGIEASRRIRAETGKDIPIILLSAYDWEEVEQQAVDAGVNGFLTKPVFRSELLQRLRHYLVNSASEPPREEKTVCAQRFDGMRILLAEDNDLNREIAEELLRGRGIQVESVENGLLAVERVEQRPAGYYDMVLMDIHMPVMDGYTAAEKIRERDASLPIVAMTADAFEEDIRKCAAAGMAGHISKPLDTRGMFEVIQKNRKENSGGQAE